MRGILESRASLALAGLVSLGIKDRADKGDAEEMDSASPSVPPDVCLMFVL